MLLLLLLPFETLFETLHDIAAFLKAWKQYASEYEADLWRKKVPPLCTLGACRLPQL